MLPIGLQTHTRNPKRNFVSTSVSAWMQFSPLAYQPLLWLDAADQTTITASSGAVSNWADKSGNGYDFTQSTASAKPTTGAYTQNGLNLIRFDGDDWLERSTNITTSSYTLFAVYSNTNVGTAAIGHSLFSSLTNSPVWFLQKGGGTSPLQDLTVGYDLNLLFDTSTKRIITAAKESDTGPRNLRSNRTIYNPTGQDNGTIYLGYIGRRFDGNYLKCDVCEVILYRTRLSLSAIETVERYLAYKWAVY